MKKNMKINISEEPRCKDLESIGSVFAPLMKGVLSTDDLVEVDIILRWDDIIGDEISKFSTPVKVKYNHKTDIRTINIEVPVGGFALELQHREQYIINKINAYFGYNAIHKISINQNANMIIKRPASNSNMKKKITEEEKKYLLEISDGINDEKLKEILIKLGENVISSNKENA